MPMTHTDARTYLKARFDRLDLAFTDKDQARGAAEAAAVLRGFRADGRPEIADVLTRQIVPPALRWLARKHPEAFDSQDLEALR